MSELFTPDELIDIVDQLAQIRAQIADLKCAEESYKSMLIASGHKAIDGTTHRATITNVPRTVTDWRTVADRLNPSPQLIRAHTTTGAPVPTVRIFGRNTV
jgi:hypothetical protein